MAVMMGPNGRPLPIATGAAAGMDSGGSRGESITSDTGNRPAAPREAPANNPPVRESLPEPKDDEELAASAPAQVAVEPNHTGAEYIGADEIDALHARFDAMEIELKRRLAVATLHARFDALQQWLAERFP